MNGENQIIEQAEVLPVETPDTEISTLVNDEDPEVRLARIERVAELAPRYEAAIRKILLSCTFPQDWETFDTKVCLSSAGAERVGKHFPIRFFEVSGRKEEWTDKIGKAYRYVYEGKATLGDRVVFAQGNFSTRDKFLGFANREWRAIEDINEGNIRNAAYHVFCGNAIKALLGLRGLPASEFSDLMKKTGQDAAKAGKHSYANGTQGGTSTDDRGKQKELAQICIQLAQACLVPVLKDDGKTFKLMMQGDTDLADIDDEMEVAAGICRVLSGFNGKDGWVDGKPASQLKGKWLNTALNKAREVAKELKGGD